MFVKISHWLICTTFTIVSYAIALQANGQPIQKPLRILTTKDGLPQSFISGLIQDKNGFVWIGTRNGLARYDGIRFKVFNHSSKDTTSLNSNVIISLAKDKSDRIWIEHEALNIDVFDPETETIVRVTERPLFKKHPLRFIRNTWLGDAEGNLWLTERAKGFHKYDWKKQQITHYTRKTHQLPSDTIRGFLEDHKNTVWVVSQRGITQIDPKSGKPNSVNFPFSLVLNSYEDSDIEPLAVHERKNGEILFGDRKQLIFYHPQKKSFRTLPLPFIPAIGIRCIQTGPDGKEYLESDGNVYRYEEQKGLVQVGDIALRTIREAKAFLIDKSGLIWLGTNAAGIHQIDLSTPFFESHPTTFSFHQDIFKEELGIALDKFADWPVSDDQFIASSYHFRSTYDRHHRLWLVLRDQVGFYDKSTKKVTLLPKVPGLADKTNKALGVRGLSFAPNGTLWVIGYNGYVGYFDSTQKKWITFLNPAVLQKINPTITLLDILADQNTLWITTGTGDGLFSIDIRTKEVRQFNHKNHPDMLPSDLVQGLQQDPIKLDILWIGTFEGLVQLNKKTLKSRLFVKEDGLPDNTIYSILTDDSGYFWLSTNRGLCRFHPQNYQVQTFQSADGLPGDEFNRFQHLQLPDGRLAFGGTEGWTIFDPTSMKVDNFQPQVVFTGLKINNLTADQNSPTNRIPKPLNSLTELALPYDQNTLAFEFAGMEFNRPKKLKYRYQLEGYDKEWLQTENTPTAIYTKLPPGSYNLKINSSNSTGQWSNHIRELKIVVHPPVWLTWWAYCLYLLFFGLLLWTFIRFRLNRERLKQEVLLKEKEAQQLKSLDELKNHFFSNITHEFRTPLTLILTPAQRLKTTLKNPDQHRWIDAIERNSYQLLKLINQLLDLAKLEAGNLKINEGLGNVGDFVDELIQPFYTEAEAQGIVLKFDKRESENYWFDSEKLERIVSNLVANAIKFTPREGVIEITLHPTTSEDNTESTFSKSGEGIILSVSDTGIGIPPEKIPHIFDRFYQVEDPKNHRQGSGIGLSLVKELVELLNGTIVIESPVNDSNWSTRFTIWLPFRKAKSSDAVAANPLDKESTTPTSIAAIENLEAPSILLVEDNVELAEFIADSLPDNYKISKAVNGNEGLAMALELLPDLVISDVLMPVMDGLEFCKKLKEDDRINHIPVVLLTAKGTFANRMEGLALGADDYLTKPFHIQELQLRVSNLLDRQRRLREKMHQEITSPSPAIDPPETEIVVDIFIQKIYSILDEKLDDSTFGVEELAAQLGMSRANLHRKVKALTGTPPGDMMRNYRLRYAAKLLKEGFNSSETAYRVGFDSPAYFSKCFRDFYQVTPHEFAQSVNKRS